MARLGNRPGLTSAMTRVPLLPTALPQPVVSPGPGLLLCGSALLLLVMAATDSGWFFNASLDDGGLALIGITFVNAIF